MFVSFPPLDTHTAAPWTPTLLLLVFSLNLSSINKEPHIPGLLGA